MARLIDAEHLKKRATDTTGDCWDNYGQGTTDLLEYIDNEPTVDAVEVVRCKDCKYFGDYEDGKDVCSMMIIYPTKPTDYCSLGERKEDGNNDNN